MFDPDSDSAFASSQQKEGRNYVKFYRQWVRNNFKSNAEGREVGEEQDFILIISPGNSKTEVRRKANDADKMAYSQEWAAYLQGKEHQVAGTPIEMLPGIPNGMADALKAMYIYTIEQMAGISDIALQKVGMGGNEIRRKCQSYLAGGSSVTIKDELDAAKISITTLQTANAALQAQIATLEAAASARKPVRKRRDSTATEPARLT